jgi:hypothetical protein
MTIRPSFLAVSDAIARSGVDVTSGGEIHRSPPTAAAGAVAVVTGASGVIGSDWRSAAAKLSHARRWPTPGRLAGKLDRGGRRSSVPADGINDLAESARRDLDAGADRPMSIAQAAWRRGHSGGRQLISPARRSAS